jgi:hypothetical protein
VFKEKNKKDVVVRPLILVVVKKLVGPVPNREKFLKGLGLPFKLDIVKNELRVIPLHQLPVENLDNLKGVVIHLSEDPKTAESFFSSWVVKPLVHYTALSYKAMTPAQADAWKSLDQSLRLLPSNI